MAEFMRSSDAFTWAMESDPRLRSTVVTVLILEKAPDWNGVRDRIDLVTRKLPMFRQRVVESPAPAPPRWEFDPDFDFDRARPLWSVTLIDGLADGGAAVLCNFHHALTDGVGGVQIGMTLFDLSELPSASPCRLCQRCPAAVVERIPRRVRLRRGACRNGAGGSDQVGSERIYDSVRRPIATLGSVTATAASIYRTVRPVNRTGSALMKSRTLASRCRCSLAAPECGFSTRSVRRSARRSTSLCSPTSTPVRLASMSIAARSPTLTSSTSASSQASKKFSLSPAISRGI